MLKLLGLKLAPPAVRPWGMRRKLGCLGVLVLSVSLLMFAHHASAAPPNFQVAGTAVNGTTAITVVWPTHQANDIGLLIIETANQAVTLGTNAADWTQVTNSPQGTGTAGGTAATRLTVFWSRATSSAMGSVGVNVASGDHQSAQIITFRGVITSGNPWDSTPAGDVAATAATAVSIPGATTTVANTLVVAIVANATDTTTAQTSGWTNADLSSLIEQADGNTSTGNGGGFGVATGVKAAAGAYSATTATLATSSVQGRMSIALRPTCESVADATYVAVNAQPTQAIVYWSSANPVVILEKSGSAITDVPTNGTTYSAGQTIGASTVKFAGSGTSYTRTSLTNGTTYYYKVFANASACYSSGTPVVARPVAGPSPAWSYNLAGGSMLVAGIAGSGTIYTGSNASQIIGLSTADGTQSWTPVATTQPIQAWLTWLPTYGGWPYRKPITIDHTKVTAALTNFPVLISLTTDADLQANAQASGNDIFFTSADGATKLSHEIEKYTSGTGNLVAWVQVPSLSNTTDTVLYMYYGNPTAPNQQGVTGTWDTNYQGVWHLNQGTGVTAVDSTSNANSAVPNSGNPTASTGQIGGALTFASPSRLVIAADATLDLTTYSNWTMSAWVKPTTYTGTSWPTIYSYGSYRASMGLSQVEAGTDGRIENWTNDTTGLHSTSAVTLNAWNYVTVTRTATTTSFYLNGSANGSFATPAAVTTANQVSGIGADAVGTIDSAEQFKGLIDEMRVSNIARPATWISTEYNNQSSPGTFSTVGAVQANSGAVVLGAEQSGRVYAVDAVGGGSIWQVTPGDLFQAPVAVQAWAWADATFQSTYSDDVLFVPTRNASTTTNKLYAIKRNNGTVAWSFNGTVSPNNMDMIVGMPWIDYTRNYVYVVSYSNGGTQPSLWVINSLTGAKVASFSLGDIQASPTMSVDGKTVYVGTTGGRLYAVDMSTLALKWSGTGYVNLGTNVAVQGFIWENGDLPGRLYFATSDGNVWSLQDPGSGAAPPASLWKTAVAAPSTPLPLGNPADRLYVGSSDGTVWKLNLTTGASQGQTTIGDGTKQVGDVSTETGNEIFVGTTEGTLYKLSPLP